MRLDKFLAGQSAFSRKQIARLIKEGKVCINGEQAVKSSQKITKADRITLNDTLIEDYDGIYIMLNKGAGVVCSRDDAFHKSIFDYFDYPLKERIHCVGRLDSDTTGLILLTDDGDFSHRVTSPKHGVEKCYRVRLADPICEHYYAQFEQGIVLRGEKTKTKSAKFEAIDDYNGYLTISEGRYHQVKRMFAALGNRVIALHRQSIGDLVLDHSLAQQGAWRFLTDDEIDALKRG